MFDLIKVVVNIGSLQIKYFGSGAFTGKMLDLGLLIISCWVVFFLFLATAVTGSNPAGLCPNSFPNPAGLS